jgi:hypothetical protein
MHRRNLNKQSLQGQVSVKLTPEICINNASSNSRLTAVGRWATATDTIHRTVYRLFFLSPYLWRENNWTTPTWWKTYWNCIAFELGTLCLFVCFLLCAVLFYFIFPLWWDNYRTTMAMEAPSPGLEAEGRTPKLLRLKLYCIWTCRFLKIFLILFIYIFFHLLIFNFYSYFYSFYFLFSILSLSL